MSHVWAVVAVVGMSVGWLIDPTQAGGKASISDSGEFVELRQEGEGRTVVDLLPLHRSGGARYFSAGVGLEARAVEYPPFSLKIVFTAGGKPFLSGVAVAIQPSSKGERHSRPFHGSRSMVHGCSWICRPGYTTSPPHMATTRRLSEASKWKPEGRRRCISVGLKIEGFPRACRRGKDGRDGCTVP